MPRTPPMPEPISTPARSALDSSISRPGIGHRHVRRRQAVVDEGIHPLGVLGRQPGLRVEVAHFTSDVRGVVGGVEVGDLADAGTAIGDRFPGAVEGIADGRDDAHAGDDDATLAHDDCSCMHWAAQARRHKCMGPRKRGPSHGPLGLRP
jgi:hypothetical protein